MKKNLITVVILAICIVNLILNAVMVFTIVPASKKTDNLVTEISSILKLELQNGDSNAPGISDLAVYNLKDYQVINLKNDGTGENHYVQIGISLSLDKNSDDYADLLTLLESAEGLIYDDARNVVSNYTYSEANDTQIQAAMQEEILKKLKDRFQTDCIYSLSFSKFTTQ